MTQPKGQWLSMGATSGLFRAMLRPLYGSRLTWMLGHCRVLMAMDQSLIFHESKDSQPQTWDRGGGCGDKCHILPPLEILFLLMHYLYLIVLWDSIANASVVVLTFGFALIGGRWQKLFKTT